MKKKKKFEFLLRSLIVIFTNGSLKRVEVSQVTVTDLTLKCYFFPASHTMKIKLNDIRIDIQNI